MSLDLFDDEVPPGKFSLPDQIACIQREIRYRERCYPRWLQTGTLTKEVADYEIACMRQVLRTLRALINDGK